MTKQKLLIAMRDGYKITIDGRATYTITVAHDKLWLLDDAGKLISAECGFIAAAKLEYVSNELGAYLDSLHVSFSPTNLIDGYYDCACEGGHFIRPHAFQCPDCKADPDDQPDSRWGEAVLALQNELFRQLKNGTLDKEGIN